MTESNSADGEFPFRVVRTADRGRACFASAALPADARVFCAAPYSAAVSAAFRAEVCARCFFFAGGYAKLKVKSERGRKWFCSEACRDADAAEKWTGELDALLQKLEDDVNARKKRKQRSDNKKHSAARSAAAAADGGKRIGTSNGNVEKLTKEERRKDKLEAAKVAASSAPAGGNESGSDSEDFGLDALAIDSDEEAAPLSRPTAKPEDVDPTKSPSFLSPPSPEESNIIGSWIDAYEFFPASAIFPDDYAPEDDELDIARSVLSCLVRRSFEPPHEQRNPEGVLPNKEPDYGDYCLLQNCERPYLLSLLRRLPAADRTANKLPEAYKRDLRAFYLLQRLLPSRIWNPHGTTDTPSSIFRSILFRERANTFGIWEPVSSSPSHPDPDSDILGSAVYPLASFFNHSCEPTLYRMQVGQRVEFRTRREINVGEELTISYGEVMDSLGERRSKLASEYFFWCSCARCVREAGET